MDKEKLHTLPRLFVPGPLARGAEVALDAGQAHYLSSVLRRKSGDGLRLFDGRSGEWLAEISAIGKKSARAKPLENLAPQPPDLAPLQMIFAPLKKDRMDFLIEKAVELGATGLRPVLTERTTTRTVNSERLRRQIVEAAEQCERFDLPVLHDPEPLAALLGWWPGEIPIFACIERVAASHLKVVCGIPGPRAILVGPEGGFSASERETLLKHPALRPASLGPRILRAETAALAALALCAE